MIHVKQFLNKKTGNPVNNHYLILGDDIELLQSRDTVVAKEDYTYSCGTQITIDTNAMGYSKTTSKYLYQYLGMNRKGITEAVLAGAIQVANLNE